MLEPARLDASRDDQNVGARHMQIFGEGCFELTAAQQQSESESKSEQQQGDFRLSQQRWLILLAMAIYGLVLAAAAEFRSILSVLLEIIGLDIRDYQYIKPVFMYLPAFTSIPTAWFIDQYGIKPTMYIASVFLLVGNGFRFLLFHPSIGYHNWGSSFKLICWIVAGFAGTQGAGIYFCTPLKVSESWFGESERSVTWSVLISAYNIGVSVASFALPRFIERPDDTRSLAYLNLIGAIVAAATVVACITRSRPQSPPSARVAKSAQNGLPWLQSLRRMLGHRDIVLHLVHETIYDSMTMAAHSVIQSILEESGHSSVFAGDVLSASSLLSVVLVIGLAATVHRIRDILLTVKLASVLRTALFILHLYSMLYCHSDRLVMGVAVLYVTLKCWSLPNNNNMTGHLISGTASEATVTGLSVTLYVIFSVLNGAAFAKFMHQDKLSGRRDYTAAVAMASVVCLLNCLMYLVFFRGQQAKK